MDLLPKELQYFILAKLDGSSLDCARNTCQMWKDIVKDLECGFNIWLRCCLREIPTAVLVSLTGIVQLNDIEDLTLADCSQLHWKYWKEIYLEYKRCGLVKNWKPQKVTIAVPNCFGKTTVVELRESFLVSGHEDGSVILWENLEEKESINARIIHQHHKEITDIKIISSDETVDDVCRGQNCWVVASSSFDSDIKMTDLNTEGVSTIIELFSKRVNSLSCWGRYLVAAAYSSMMVGQPVWRISNKPLTEWEKVWQLHGHIIANLMTVAMWGTKVVTGDLAGNLMCWTLPPGQEDPVIMDKFDSNLKQICLQEDNMICLLGDGSLCLRRKNGDFDRFTPASLFETFEGTPENLALRGPLLAVGVTFGKVFLYHLPHKLAWKSLDFTQPAAEVKTGNQHITGISIGDDGVGPVIVIATDDGEIGIHRWRSS